MTDRISAAEDRMRSNRLETRMTATGAVCGGRGSEGGSMAAAGAFSRSRCKVGVGATDAPATSESQKYV